MERESIRAPLLADIRKLEGILAEVRGSSAEKDTVITDLRAQIQQLQKIASMKFPGL